MKKSLILCSAIFISSCALTDPYNHLHPHGAYAMKLFKKQDSNGDGAVTKKEAYAHHKSMFDKVDSNKDGKLSRSEAKKAGYLEDFHDLGTKKTSKGHLTAKETFTVESYRFAKADTNKDGKITKSEYKKHYLESFKK